MPFGSCFPELPGGGCWPRDAGSVFRRCFPDSAVAGRARRNEQLRPAGAPATIARVRAGAVATAMGVMLGLGRCRRP
jgi:hypothetical protein